ncbi:UNVERIFIED_CONTAM: putative ribonuclease H protein, partial [Sesamum radiatum]
MLSVLWWPTPTHQDRACIDAYISPPSPESTRILSVDLQTLRYRLEHLEKNVYHSYGDYLHWRLSKHSAFRTKSAWNEIRDQQPVQQFHKSLWSKLLIPNISVFAWRLIHNLIPVDERLKEKGITLASKCLCCEDTETIPHLFLHNAHSPEAWGFFASKFQVNIPHTNDIVILIQSWKTSFGTKPYIRDVIPLLILWNIWNLRNESKYEGVAFKASTIIRKTVTYLNNLQKCGIMDTEHVKGDLFTLNSLHIPIQQKSQRQKATTVHWRKPQEGWYKLNMDGASKGNPGISGAGGILQDQLGKVIFAFQEPLGIATNTQAELSAIHRGLQIYVSRGLRKVWIETDATAIIKLISAPQRGAWNLQANLQNIRKILNQMEHKLSHIFREGNQVADFLANQACYIQQLCIFHEDTIPGKVKGTMILMVIVLVYLFYSCILVAVLTLLFSYTVFGGCFWLLLGAEIMENLGAGFYTVVGGCFYTALGLFLAAFRAVIMENLGLSTGAAEGERLGSESGEVGTSDAAGGSCVFWGCYTQ